MMKTVTCLILMTFGYILGYSCDVCGGFNSSYSLLNTSKKNSIQLQYLHSRYQNSSSDNNGNTDNFQVYSLLGRFKIIPKLYLTGSIPYTKKKRSYESSSTQELQGLGDIVIQGSYVFIQKSTKRENKLFLEGGLGVKLKNGSYENSIIDKNLPKSYNLGNGSLGIPLNMRFIYSKKKKGLAARATYQWNDETFTGHKFGNTLGLSAFYFQEFAISKTQIIPQIALVYDRIEMDHYPNNSKNEKSGGSISYFAPGAQIKKNNFLIGLGTQLPLKQNFNNTNIRAKAQFNLQLTYLI